MNENMQIGDAYKEIDRLRAELEQLRNDTTQLLEWILNETPVDFLGTGSDSRLADKQEREWHDKITNAIKKMKS